MNEHHFDGALGDQLRRFYHDVYGSVGLSEALWSAIASRLDGEQLMQNEHITYMEPSPPDTPAPRTRITHLRPRYRRLGTAVAVLLAGLIVVASIALFRTLHTSQPGTHVATPTQAPTGCSPAATKVSLPHNAEISDMVLTGPTSGWAVGAIDAAQQQGTYQQSLILQLKDCQWSPAGPMLPNVGLLEVAMISSDEGWMIGNDDVKSSGVMLHLTHGQWQTITPALPSIARNGGYYHISMLSATEGWLIEFLPKSSDGQTNQLLLHLHEGTWSVVTTPFVGEYDVMPIAPDDAWIAATGPAPQTGSTSLLYHYQHGTWTAAHVPAGMSINQLHLNAPDDAWATGDFTSSTGDSPALLRYDGTTWSQVTLNLRNPAQELYMLSATEGWAIGTNRLYRFGNGRDLALIQRYSNGQWIPVGLPSSPLSDITQISCGAVQDCWAIGVLYSEQTSPDGRGSGSAVTKLLHYVDGQWTVYSAP